MKFWTWIKSLGFVVVIGAVLAAVLMVLGSFKAGRETRRADRNEKQIEAIAHDRTKKGIEKAAKLQKEKDKHLDKAAAARQRMEAQLEKISEDDEMADIADRFNKRQRLRNHTG